MSSLRFLAVIVLLSAALPVQAGFIAQADHPRFSRDGFGMPRLDMPRLNAQQDLDWVVFLPAVQRNWNHYFPRGGRVNLHRPDRGHEGPGVPELPLVQPPTAVWEPPVLGLMGLGLVGLFGARRRMRQQAG